MRFFLNSRFNIKSKTAGYMIIRTNQCFSIFIFKNPTCDITYIHKSNLSYKVKQELFQDVVVSVLLYSCTIWTLKKRLEKKLDGDYARVLCCFESILEAAPYKTTTVRPLTSNFKNHPSKMNKTRMNSLARFSRGLL